jgi:hypothetical protein
MTATLKARLIEAVNSGRIDYTKLDDHETFDNIEEMVEYMSGKAISETLKDFGVLAEDRRDIHEMMDEMRRDIARDMGLIRR